jgi:tetratricopeptide (TPR) repeat protein
VGDPMSRMAVGRIAVMRWSAAAAALAAGLLAPLQRPAAQPTETSPPTTDYDDEETKKSDFWEKALDPASEKYDDLVERAVVLMREADQASLVQAGQLLAEALRLSPNRAVAHLWQGRVSERQGAYAACAQSIAKALDLDPDLVSPGGSEPAEWSAPYELAVCQARSGKYEEAIEGLRRILGRAQGAQVIVFQRLGECYMALGRLDEAIESFRQGLRLSPYTADLGFALAVAHDRDEDAAQSRDALNLALIREPRAGVLTASSRVWIPAEDANYYLGLAYLGADDAPRSVLHFRRYLAKAGEKNWSRRARARYEEALGSAVAGQGLDIRGSASLDQPRAGAAIARSDGALQTCLRKAPDLLLRVSITEVVPTKGKTPPAPAGTARPGVRVLVQESSETKSTDFRATIDCAESAARKIKLPKPAGAPGTYVTAEFNVVSR